jgi:putative redox protein
MAHLFSKFQCLPLRLRDFNKKSIFKYLYATLCLILWLGDDVQATVKWVDGVMFVGETGSGHAIVMDGPADHGGRNMGIRPMEMILLGVGGCSSFDVVQILQKGRNHITDCVAEITAERVDAVPSVFSKIHLHFVVTGHDLKAATVERAVKLSAEKYCSAAIMLGAAGVEMTHDFEVIEV